MLWCEITHHGNVARNLLESPIIPLKWFVHEHLLYFVASSFLE